MWDFLESVCKLQDMYYTCKAYLILFRHIFFCFVNQYKHNAILRWDEFYFVISYMTQTGHFFVMHVMNCFFSHENAELFQWWLWRISGVSRTQNGIQGYDLQVYHMSWSLQTLSNKSHMT